MASCSTSSIQKSFKYDVFLSFRGEDTRRSFVDHLYDALKRENIHTYKDDKNLEKGKKISKELIKAIEESRFHVVIFSKNYASSSWCLDELVKIMECQNTTIEHIVYPIFYDVEPTQVRKQSGEFGIAFVKHEKDEAVEKWRKALVEATSFSGRDLSTTNDGHEVEFIKIVVREISLRLPSISADENLIGMRTRINGVVSSLNAFRDEFCMIGIAGMGGSGKTTLARAVFDQICNEFQGSSFVENVRECSNSLLIGLKLLQQQVLRDVLNRQDIIVNGVLEGKKEMKKNMPRRKVLIVLDDVDHIDQLKALAGEPNWFMKGSIIIITTRDKQVLIAHKVNFIHDANLLTDEEAICLLSRCAFGTEIPIPGYEKLSEKVVSYAAGLPLTITILGSSLCDENEHVWIDTLKELEKIPLDGTLQKLELSYTGLDTNCKEIFLDVACILKGWDEGEAIRVLESRGFHAIRGLSVLQKKHLITISRDGRLDMHDHIQEMGRYIVRRSNLDEPRRHTRLWIQEEIEDILTKDLGTEATTCIYLFPSRTTSRISGVPVKKGFGNMKKLRLLLVDGFAITRDWELDEDSQYFPNSLQYLKWKHYPFCFLPKTFQASNLVVLEMSGSKIIQHWEGGERKVLDKLRFLRLGDSKLKAFDLGLAPNLEMLDLGSYHLEELHMPGCPELKSLRLTDSKLNTLDLSRTPNIEILNLERCNNLVELHIPHNCSQLKSLILSGSKLSILDLSLIPNLETLNLESCNNLVELHIPHKCSQLKYFKLTGSKLSTLDLSLTPNVETLNLMECKDLVELHIPHKCSHLKSLKLIGSKLSTLDLGLTQNIEILNLESCDNLVELHIPHECPQLKSFKLTGSKLSTLDLSLTPNLETLKLKECKDLVELHMPREWPELKSMNLSCQKLRSFNLDDLVLPRLKSLDIKRCLALKTLDLGRNPNLKSLSLEKCPNLVKLYAPVGGLKKLTNLKAQGFQRFSSFDISNLRGLPELILSVELVDICPLHPDNKLPKFQFDCSYWEDLPSSIGNIEKLISIGFSCACTDLESFFGSICGLQHLTNLTFEGSIPEAPKDLDRLQCLEELTLSFTEIKHLPDSICMLTHLKSLELYNCELLEKLPKDLGRLECLETLVLWECIRLQDIPNSICRMKCLKYLSLPYCNRVEELPEELGCLECLEELNIEGTCINHLPQSILSIEKGLRIVGSRELFESCGLTSKIQTSEHTTYFYEKLCYVEL